MAHRRVFYILCSALFQSCLLAASGCLLKALRYIHALHALLSAQDHVSRLLQTPLMLYMAACMVTSNSRLPPARDRMQVAAIAA